MQFFKYFRLILVPFIAAMLWIGCAKDDPTPLEKFRILQAHNAIDSVANAALISDNPEASFKLILEDIQQMDQVEEAEISEEGKLCVKYKEGGSEVWGNDPRWIDPPYAKNIPGSGPLKDIVIDEASSRTDCLVGNKKACLINTLFDDPAFSQVKAKIDQMSTILIDAGFDVTVVNGSNAHLNFYGSAWDDFGVIYNYGHGFIYRNMTWLTTGQKITEQFNTILDDHYDVWRNEKISIYHTYQRGQDNIVTRSSYYNISSKFFDYQYLDGSFPNSVIDITSCNAMRLPDMKSVLNKKGAQATIGWSNIVNGGIGIVSGIQLFNQMISGKNLEKAYEGLPADLKKNQNAILSYYPYPAGGCARLVEDTNDLKITITAPFDGSTINSRTVYISGYIDNATFLTNSVIEINGVTSKLEVDNNYYFSQNIVLESGTNNVRIIATGLNENDEPSSGEATVKLLANFPPLALWTRLVWNTADTDVDFHLIPPGTSTDDLFTYNDCYFGQRSTSWGAYLDVDDRYGYGPEHITLPDNPAPGVYTLIVHYWETHSGNPPDAFISVATRTETWKSNPLPLSQTYVENNHGDTYAVCKIEFPSGKIYPLEEKIVTSRNDNMVKIKKDNTAKNQLTNQ